MIDQAFILAAGLGTRLRPLTEIIPKPLLPLAGKPILHLLLDHLAALGVARVGINAHHRAGMISRALETRTGGPDTTLFREQGRIRGTGGGLGQAAGFFDPGPILVISPKIMFDFDLREVVAAHRDSGASVSMVLLDRPGYNRVTVRGDRILGFREDAVGGAGTRRLAYTSVQVVEPAVFKYLPKNGPGDMIEAYRTMIREGHHIRGHILDEDRFWLNLASLADYLEFHRRILVRGKSAFGHGPAGPVFRERTAELSPGARVEGFAYLGHGVRVASGARIRDAVVLDKACLEKGAEVIRGVIGPGLRFKGRLKDHALIA